MTAGPQRTRLQQSKDHDKRGKDGDGAMSRDDPCRGGHNKNGRELRPMLRQISFGHTSMWTTGGGCTAYLPWTVGNPKGEDAAQGRMCQEATMGMGW